MVYENLIESYEERRIDTFEQLRRRINTIVYHWKDESGYHQYAMPMTEYKDYHDLGIKARDGFMPVPDGADIPFD